MVKLLVPLILLGCILYVNGDATIVVAAFEKIYKYAAAAKVKTLTANCNKAATLVKAKAVVTAWVPKNWKAPTATLNASDPYSKQAYALSQGLAFIESRWALKKYVNYMHNQFVATKYITAAEGKTMLSVFWAADVANNNNYTLTSAKFLVDAQKAITGKTPNITENILIYTEKFQAKQPVDYDELDFEI